MDVECWLAASRSPAAGGRRSPPGGKSASRHCRRPQGACDGLPFGAEGAAILAVDRDAHSPGIAGSNHAGSSRGKGNSLAGFQFAFHFAGAVHDNAHPHAFQRDNLRGWWSGIGERRRGL